MTREGADPGRALCERASESAPAKALRDDKEEQWGKAPPLNVMRCNRETERRHRLDEQDAAGGRKTKERLAKREKA